MTAIETPAERPTWTVRPPSPRSETREGKYRGLTVTVDANGWFLYGAKMAGHSVSASRRWYIDPPPNIDAIADAAIVAADELLAAGWVVAIRQAERSHQHDWRKHDDGEHCYTCRAER